MNIEVTFTEYLPGKTGSNILANPVVWSLFFRATIEALSIVWKLQFHETHMCKVIFPHFVYHQVILIVLRG